MNFNCNRKTGCLQKTAVFCCTQKRDLLKNDNFEKTIDIYPRIIVLKKLKPLEVYCQTITVRNTGTLCRQIQFLTEPNNDISLTINGSTNLHPGAYVSVDVVVKPTKKKSINRNRCFFVLAKHPDIVWEIPLIVLKNKEHEVFVPEIICLPKVPANTVSNYQFLVYNPQDNEVIFSVCSNYEGVTIKPFAGTIPAKDYFKILIVGKVQPEPITTSILLTLRNGKSFKIFVKMELSNQLVHLSTSELILEDTYIGLKSQKKIFICNRSNECVSFQWTNNIGIDEHSEICDKEDEKLIISEFITIKNKRGCIPAMSSILSIFSFTPPANFRYIEEEPHLQTNEVVYLYCPILGPQSYRVHISGRILGPSIVMNPTEIDIGNLYMGQNHCVSFEVLNKGPILGEIYFKDHTDKKEISCSVTPSSIHIKPDGKKSIQLSFYRRDVGKFITKLNFKIRSGDFYSILIRGISLPTKVKVFPELFQFGNVPICIPQKGSATIFNSLPVSVVVEPKIVDDGVENPLILCVDNFNLPLNTRTAIYHNTNHNLEKLEEDYPENCCSDFSSNKENSSRTNFSSQISALFQNVVLDDIPVMATELLQNFKAINSQDQLETGIRIIDASLDYIFNRCDYFQELRDNRNYQQLNWNALPCDAKELATEEEGFYLEPNETKTIPFVLVPNSVGPSTKTIQFRVYPMDISNCSDIKDTINSIYMTNSLRLQYNCMIPILEYNNDISFSQPLYVDMKNTFNMNFKNIDILPGFVYFKVIPTSNDGTMQVEKKQQKFYIAAGDKIEVACSVIFRKVGKIVLHGIFQLVGKLLEYSFKLEAEVIPPKIQISMERIFAKLEVLELTRTKIFITNISPTVAKLTFSLKNEKHQFLEPQGASLAPNQKILISLFSKFLDPGLYKNFLYIHLKHSENLIIPITISVEGAPLNFEPNIKLGLDFGTLFRNNKVQEHIIKITNLGEKSYKINFQKKNAKKIAILPIIVFNIEPNIFKIAPNTQEIVKIQLDISKEVKCEEEFCVDGIIMDEGKHKLKLFSFPVKCNVIESKVLWSKNEIRFEIKTDPLMNLRTFDVVSLINTTQVIANVNLIVQGYFVVGQDCEGIRKKSIDLIIEGKTSKEIYVSFNEMEVGALNLMCQCFKGSIKCKVNNKTQKSLPLHVKTISPGLRICNPKVTLFPPYTDSFAHISIHNCSLLNATFTWKEVESIILDEPLLSELCVEQIHSKTISELILTMPKDSIPNFPNSLKSQYSESLIVSDQESSDEETSRERKSSSEGTVDLKHKPSFRNSRTEDFVKSSSSSTIDLSSEETILQPIKCNPLPSSKVETQNIGIDEIFDFLGLSEKLSTQPSSDFYKGYDLTKGDTNYKKKNEFEERKQIDFQHKWGKISPKSMFKAYLFLPALPKDKTLVSKFNLEVIGGQTEILDLTVTSQQGRIQVSRTDINLGTHIWYTQIMDKIKITSISKYSTKITIVEKNKFNHEKDNNLAIGYVEILSQKQFILMPKTSTEIEFKIALGLRQNFIESIGLEINNNTTAIPIQFRGSGVFPVCIPIRLKRIPQTSVDITQSYFYLRDLFNDTQRKYIQSFASTHDDNSIKTILKDEKDENYETKLTFKLNKTRNFVLLNYSEEKYPRAEVIDRVVETERFIFNLFKSNELMTRYHKFYNKCVHLRAMEFDPIINLKRTICRPIPWKCLAFNFDINGVRLNETKSFEMEMLFLSLKTQVAIPGLSASFEAPSDLQKNGFSKMFIFFLQSPEDKSLKKYKNIHERSSNIDNNHIQDAEVDILHSHSYDFDEVGVHQRKKLSNEIKQIKEQRYTKISQSIKEKKNPLILTEICQTTDEDLTDLKLKLNLKLTVSNEFYEINQIIEDYLFIDIHLGPTVPILLKGKIVPT